MALRTVCAECGHHRSMHVYDEDALRGCRLCDCPGWRPPQKYERLKRRPIVNEELTHERGSDGSVQRKL